MASKDDIRKVKEVLDLFELLETLGEGRPPVGVMLKYFNISPEIMSHAVVTTYRAASVTFPDTALQIVNDLFKLGVTIGYKYAISKDMDRQFGDAPQEEEEE